MNSKIINLQDERRKKRSRTKEPQKTMSPRQKKKIARNRIRLLVIAGILLAIFGVSIYKIVSLKFERIQLQKEQTRLVQEKEKLKKESEDVNSIDYIEKKAREELKLVLPGEIIYNLPKDLEKK